MLQNITFKSLIALKDFGPKDQLHYVWHTVQTQLALS